jgi:hypothetical protein
MTTSPTVFPTAIDYVRAVQHPTRAFRDPALQRAEFRRNPHRGTPDGIRGSYAMVFRAEVAGEPRALRFFLRTAGDPGRYRALERHVTSAGLRAEVPPATWTDEAILVKGQRWPMINTAWVDGRALDSHVEELADQGDSARLYELAQRWRTLMDSLQRARFAHGDLQHGNVLVGADGTVRLVDLDTAWIADFAGSQVPEPMGHRNYQLKGHTWGPWMDSFPGLVIYTGLLALARHPALWTKELTADRVVFGADDFTAPATSEVWRQLRAVDDARLSHALGVLERCCKPGWRADRSLSELLESRASSVSGAVVPPGTERWWERVTPAPAPRPAPSAPPPPRPRAGGDAAAPDWKWATKVPAAGSTARPTPPPAPPPPTPPPPRPRVQPAARPQTEMGRTSPRAAALICGVLLGLLAIGAMVNAGVMPVVALLVGVGAGLVAGYVVFRFAE